jgi:hypothetical protein
MHSPLHLADTLLLFLKTGVLLKCEIHQQPAMIHLVRLTAIPGAVYHAMGARRGENHVSHTGTGLFHQCSAFLVCGATGGFNGGTHLWRQLTVPARTHRAVLATARVAKAASNRSRSTHRGLATRSSAS